MSCVKLCIYGLFVMVLLQSCSIQKMRYSRGFNIGWIKNGISKDNIKITTIKIHHTDTTGTTAENIKTPVKPLLAQKDLIEDRADTTLFKITPIKKYSEPVTHKAKKTSSKQAFKTKAKQIIQVLKDDSGMPFNNNAVWGMSLAILGITVLILVDSFFPFLFFTPEVSPLIFAILVMSLLSVILSVTGLIQVENGRGRGRGFAIAGLILGIFLCLAFIGTFS